MRYYHQILSISCLKRRKTTFKLFSSAVMSDCLIHSDFDWAMLFFTSFIDWRRTADCYDTTGLCNGMGASRICSSGQSRYFVRSDKSVRWGPRSMNTWNGRNLTNEISWDKETMMGFSEIKKICMEWKQTWNLLQCPRSCIWIFETICSSRPHWLNLGQMVASPLPSHRILSLLDCFNVQNRSSRTNK